MSHRPVTVSEATPGPYAQSAQTGPHSLVADEPASMSGHDTGPTPYEYLCTALGACTNMTLRMYANQKQWPLQHVTTVVRHEKVTQLNNLKQDIFHRTLTLQGPLTEEQRQRLLEIAERCPVSRTLQSTDIHMEYTLEAAS